VPAGRRARRVISTVARSVPVGSRMCSAPEMARYDKQIA